MRKLGACCVALVATVPFACHLISGVGELEFADSSSALGGTGGTTSSSSTSDSTSSSSSSTSVGGAGGAAGTGGTGGVAGGEPCHPPDLVDEFDGTELSDLWWSWDDYFVDVQVQDSQLVIWARSPDHTYGVHTRSPFDLHDCSVWADVTEVFAASVEGWTTFQIADQATWDHRLFFNASLGQLEVGTRDDGAQNVIASVTYDSQAHRYWRFREANATCHFETSADGQSWDPQGQTATADWIGSAIVVVSTGVWGYDQGEVAARFESVDVLP